MKSHTLADDLSWLKVKERERGREGMEIERDGKRHTPADDVSGPWLQGPVLLQGHEVPETDGGQCNEAIVETVEICPSLLTDKQN